MTYLPLWITDDWVRLVLGGLSLMYIVWIVQPLINKYKKRFTKAPLKTKPKPVMSFGGSLKNSTIADNDFGHNNILLEVRGDAEDNKITGNKLGEE